MKLWEDNIFSHVCRSVCPQGVQCHHYPWCIRPHQYSPDVSTDGEVSMWSLPHTHPTVMLSFYRPQQSCGGYIFTPVCHSVYGGGWSALVYAGIPPPTWSRDPLGSRHSPRADTPTLREQAPPPPAEATVADGTHPTVIHSCSLILTRRHPVGRPLKLSDNATSPFPMITFISKWCLHFGAFARLFTSPQRN